MERQIYPIVLCGGMGSRLWPMSRVEQPKQFQPVAGVGSSTFFQTTLQRHRGGKFAPPVVVTNMRHGAIVERQMRELQSPGIILAEPMGRNTGPAVLAAALELIARDPDAQMLVLPSDHIIKGDLNAVVFEMIYAADDGRIVTFGIVPHYPETGYGYIMDGGGFRNYPGLHRVGQFIEKPEYDVAVKLMTTGFSYWASGISLFRADTIIDEYERFDPKTVAAVRAALTNATRKDVPASGREHIALEEASFELAASEPTERAVFERSEAIALAPLLSIEWDDVGAWNAVHQISERTADGNAISGDVIAMDTKNSLIRAEGRLVTVIGMRDVIVVETADAVLVTNRERSQDVKKVVEGLMKDNRPQVRSHVKRDTSWGQVETLSRAADCDMRMLSVTPGATVRIGGAGSGPSLVTVLSGEGECEIASQKISIARGKCLPIDADVMLSISNVNGHDLRLVQMLFTDKTKGMDDHVSVGATLHVLPTARHIEAVADTQVVELEHERA
ncbi:MAG: sugar phosphate nucleotidyltransferase [Deltaproteobacteria bacterium]